MTDYSKSEILESYEVEFFQSLAEASKDINSRLNAMRDLLAKKYVLGNGDKIDAVSGLITRATKPEPVTEEAPASEDVPTKEA